MRRTSQHVSSRRVGSTKMGRTFHNLILRKPSLNSQFSHAPGAKRNPTNPEWTGTQSTGQSPKGFACWFSVHEKQEGFSIALLEVLFNRPLDGETQSQTQVYWKSVSSDNKRVFPTMRTCFGGFTSFSHWHAKQCVWASEPPTLNQSQVSAGSLRWVDSPQKK